VIKNQNTLGIIYALIGYSIFVIGDSSYKYMGDSYAIYHIGFYGKLAATLFFLGYLHQHYWRVYRNFNYFTARPD